VKCFTEDGTFTDESIGSRTAAHRARSDGGIYAAAFPEMHRELYRFFSIGDIVVVELALQGTHKGPLQLPLGTIPPTGQRMNAPRAATCSA